MNAYTPPIERLLMRVHINATTGCWEWLGYKASNGYGRIAINKSGRPAHRIAYTFFREAVPVTLVCDHLCRNRGCVNPWHIEIVTIRENVLRGARATKATHCRLGHPYSPDNTRINSDGGRRCILCERAWYQAKRDRDVAAYNADARERWAANRDAINARRRELAAIRTRSARGE